MIGFLIIVAWVLFGVVGAHQYWPEFKAWWTGGDYVYSDGHTPGVGPRHARPTTVVGPLPTGDPWLQLGL